MLWTTRTDAVFEHWRMAMDHAYWNDWYFSWGWFLWFGILFLFFSSIGNWGYTYQAHSKYSRLGRRPALDILDERYARGDISREEYGRLKIEIAGT
jgi:putative membrane protein